MREDEIKNKFIEFAQIKNNVRILDFGCGTGTLLLMLAEKYPDVELNDVDIDKDILKLANEKLKIKGRKIRLTSYDGTTLPYNDNYFDKVFSGLVIHHISAEKKPLILKELGKIIRPGGEIFILDFTKQRLFQKVETLLLKRARSLKQLNFIHTNPVISKWKFWLSKPRTVQ
jgi:ubiquinone/menaquinone biosynthesis C-methylase UbiE